MPGLFVYTRLFYLQDTQQLLHTNNCCQENLVDRFHSHQKIHLMELTRTKKLSRFRMRTSDQLAPHLAPATTQRITSIDLLRGLVMIIMALDHVRDYFHIGAFQYDPTDLSKTTGIVFLTRFITHFCAPVFMLLSGTSAYLVGTRKGKRALSMFLFTRGLWLVFLELTVVNFGWFFDFHYNNTGTLVIWALGVSMMALSLLIHLPRAVILAFSLTMIFGHNLLDNFHVNTGIGRYAWALLHEPKVFQLNHVAWFALYPLVPWIGVMSLGYCLGSWYNHVDAGKRKQLLLFTGIASIILFVALRYTNWYGDAAVWTHQSTASFTLLSFLNVSKYPPSLLYLLVTLGPAMIFLSFAEKSNGWLSRQIQVIGRVPMFYYLVHIYLIHFAAMAAAQLSAGHSWSDMLLVNWVSFDPKLQGYGFNLATTYLVWFALIVVLYFLCRWYDQYKRTHKHWWLSYL
jgi:uncharacterized membrane protein